MTAREPSHAAGCPAITSAAGTSGPTGHSASGSSSVHTYDVISSPANRSRNQFVSTSLRCDTRPTGGQPLDSADRWASPSGSLSTLRTTVSRR